FHTYFIKAYDVMKDENGEIIEVLATYDPETKSGSGFNARKPDGTIHFVEASQAIKAQSTFYGPLLVGDDSKELIERFNRDSLHIKYGFVENALKDVQLYDKFQFIRNGYFNTDHSKEDLLVFNETVALKSSYK